MNRRDKKVIESFTIQKAKVSTLNESNFSSWLVTTVNLINVHIGKDSFLLTGLQALLKIRGIPPEKHMAILSERLPEVERILDNCIEHIENHGIYKVPKQGLSEGWQIFWAGSFLVIYFSTMPFVCQYGGDKAERQWIEEKRDFKAKIDSLSKAIRSTPTVSDSISKPK